MKRNINQSNNTIYYDFLTTISSPLLENGYMVEGSGERGSLFNGCFDKEESLLISIIISIITVLVYLEIVAIKLW